jgi:hypothetical protein
MTERFRFPGNFDPRDEFWGHDQDPDPGNEVPFFPSPGKRFGAIFIDWVLPICFASLLGDTAATLIFYATIYNSVWKQGRTGQSFGKKIMGIKLAYVPEGIKSARPTFHVPGVGRCAVRLLVHFFDMIFFIGFLKALFDPWSRFYADVAVRTVPVLASAELEP